MLSGKPRAQGQKQPGGHTIRTSGLDITSHQHSPAHTWICQALQCSCAARVCIPCTCPAAFCQLLWPVLLSKRGGGKEIRSSDLSLLRPLGPTAPFLGLFPSCPSDSSEASSFLARSLRGFDMKQPAWKGPDCEGVPSKFWCSCHWWLLVTCDHCSILEIFRSSPIRGPDPPARLSV